MADNWGFVLAAYGLAAVVLLSYLRFLTRGERTQTRRARSRVSEPLAPTSGHPRSKPASRPPLQ